MFKKLANGVRYVENIFLGIGVFFFVALMFLGAADVIGRYAFNKPIMGALEISEVLMAGVILFGWAYAMRQGAHVRVDLFISRFPFRPQKITNFVMMIFSLLIFVIIVWRSTLLAIQYMEEHRAFQTLGYPTYPFHFFVPVGAFFLCLEFIVQLVYLIPEMRKGD